MQKKIFAVAFIAIVAMLVCGTANAQKKDRVERFNGNNNWSLEAGGIASYDKQPMTGERQAEFGAFVRVNRFKTFSNGIQIAGFLEGGYTQGKAQTDNLGNKYNTSGRRYGVLGMSVKLTTIKDPWAIPEAEISVGYGDQTYGYNYETLYMFSQGNIKGNIANHHDLTDKKLRPIGRLGLSVKKKIADQWLVKVYANCTYRPSEGRGNNALTPGSTTVEVNGEQVPLELVNQVIADTPFKSDKMSFSAGVSISFSF